MSEKAIKPCPHCGSELLFSEDRGLHCDGCDDLTVADEKAILRILELEREVARLRLLLTELNALAYCKGSGGCNMIQVCLRIEEELKGQS